MTTTLNVNGQDHTVDAPPDMPLLWVLRDLVGLTGTKFGCGIAQCGACTCTSTAEAVRSCVAGCCGAEPQKATTIEAVGSTAAGKKIQGTWKALDVVQCGYCQSGQVMSVALHRGDPSDTSTPRWTATSAAAARTTGFARRIKVPRREPDMSQGYSMRRTGTRPAWRHPAHVPQVRLHSGRGGGLTASAFPRPAKGRARRARRRAIGDGRRRYRNAAGRRVRAERVRADRPRGQGRTLVIPKVEIGAGHSASIPMRSAEELEVPIESVVISDPRRRPMRSSSCCSAAS